MNDPSTVPSSPRTRRPRATGTSLAPGFPLSRERRSNSMLHTPFRVSLLGRAAEAAEPGPLDEGGDADALENTGRCRRPILTAEAAAAQSRDDNWTRCKDNNPDLAIGGCTVIIQSGQETTKNLAITDSRGFTYLK